MSDKKSSTSRDCTVPAIEAQLMLDWINALLASKYTKLRQLGNGAAWCQLLKLMYPESIRAHLIIHQCKTVKQVQHNFNLLKSSFKAIGLVWSFAVRPLMKGNSIEILKVTRFFMQLYVRHCQRRNELLRRCTGGAAVSKTTSKEEQPKSKPSMLRKLAVSLGLMPPLSQRSSSSSSGKERCQKCGAKQRTPCQAIYLSHPFKYLFGKSKSRSSSWQDLPQPSNTALRHRRKVPDHLTSKNLLLFFEPVSESEAELELRVEALRLEKQSISDLVSRASRAMRWSPTNRRCYTLPNRMSSLRKSSEITDCMRSIGGMDNQRKPHPQKIDKLNAAELDLCSQKNLYDKNQRLTRCRLEYLIKRQRQHAELEQLVRMYMELRKGQRVMQRELQEYHIRKQMERQWK